MRVCVAYCMRAPGVKRSSTYYYKRCFVQCICTSGHHLSVCQNALVYGWDGSSRFVFASPSS